MSELFAPNPVFHADDSNGSPLSGGKLFTYAAGTTTKQVTYTDVTGGTPNTNPIILNSRGEATVLLDPLLAYKFVLAPATDSDPPTNAIWTVDGINGVLSFSGITANIVVPTRAALRALNVGPFADGQIVTCSGYWTATDRASNQFYWSSADAYDENGGTVIKPNSIIAANPGRWRLVQDDDKIKARWFGFIGDASEANKPVFGTPFHPLSEQFSTLAAAQAIYPHAAALTDEIDWCALDAAETWIFARSELYAGYNWAVGDLSFSGWGALHTDFVIALAAIDFHGDAPATIGLGGVAMLSRTGGGGSDDVHANLVRAALVADDGVSGVKGRPANPVIGGIHARFYDFAEWGTGASLTAGSPADTKYLVGISIGRSVLSEVNVQWFNGVYDGVVLTGPALYFKAGRNCSANGVFRNAITNRRSTVDFSTTIVIDEPQFEEVGKYQILLDLFGSIESFCTIRQTSNEGYIAGSYYDQNQEEWTHGVPASVCIIGGGNLKIDHVRCEGNVDVGSNNVYADLHLVECTSPDIRTSTARNIIFTTIANSAGSFPPLTAAGSAYLSAYNSLDLTASRAYNAGITGDVHAQNENVSVADIFILNKILLLDGQGLGVSGRHDFRNVEAALLSVPYYTSGGGVRLAQSRSTAVLSLMAMPANFLLDNVFLQTTGLPRWFGHFDSWTGCGYYQLLPGGVQAAVRQNSHVYGAATIGENLINFYTPQTENGFLYEVIVGGTSDSSEPSYTTTIGTTFTDGTCTVKCVGIVALVAEIGTGRGEWAEAGRRRWEASDAPATGAHLVGDRVTIYPPAHSGSMFKVCTAAGAPGTWYGAGAIL